ncbi:MAG: ribosome maturation factor RimM [Parafannyhessea sp.]|uniref:ribosome maturation factor RimM n=1 Tax=Parafannyhessea sp. TaxID=2847324 RepID=UPI003F00210D
MIKAHGRRGEVVTVPVHGLPSIVSKGLEVCVVPPELKGPRWRKVLAADGGERGQLVRLEGVNDLEAASKLVGRTLLARVEDLPNGFERSDVDWLMGRDVTDERLGYLGRISEVIVGPANDVWTVEGPYGEVMVPVVDEFVLETPRRGSIVVRVPDGTVGSDAR